MMEISGYLAAVLIGVSLGLIGGGGSILTIPVLVYLFKVDIVTATAYSLFIVGTTSVIGSISYFKKKLINFETAIVFGIPSILSVYLSRIYILPAIPHKIFSIGNITIEKPVMLMLFFAVLMLLASYKMIKKNSDCEKSEPFFQKSGYFFIVLQGTLTGLVTGLIGAGGGFLIIPALVNLLNIPMKKAIGTSLLIIAVNALAGFLISLHQTTLNWGLLGLITGFAAMGILTGTYLSSKIDGKFLKPAFGWFVLFTALYIITIEIFIR